MLHFRLFLLHQIITKEFDCLPLYEASSGTYTFVSKEDKNKFFPLTFIQLAELAAQNGNSEAFNNERDYKKTANLLGLSHHYDQYEFLIDSKVPGSMAKRLDLITEFEYYLTAKICLPPKSSDLV
ncbi:hypothetical protein CEQ90_13365 [Lewinellaceae bacterium SD302]|nr:hypothetical protein CEQ90_13365 [Lewinellaceae bacterium SD302]